MAYPMLARRAYGATGDGATLGRPKWLGGGCHGLHSSSGMPCIDVNRTLCKVLALAEAVMSDYLSDTGFTQAPRQTADRPSSAHSHREERIHGRNTRAAVAARRLPQSLCRPRFSADEPRKIARGAAPPVGGYQRPSCRSGCP